MLRPLKKDRHADESGSAMPGGTKANGIKSGSVRSAPDQAPAGQTVGGLLAQTRQKFGQDLQQVSQALRIKQTYIQAIEQDRYADLPGLAYAVGFVRSYGDYLGLDGKSLVQRYKDEAQGINRAPDLSFPTLTQEAKVPTGAIILVSLVMLGIAYGGWVYFSRETAPAPSVSAVLTLPAEETPVRSSDATAAVASEPAPAPMAPAAGEAPAAETPAAEPGAGQPAEDETPAETAAAPTVVQPADVPSAAPLVPAAPAAPSVSAAPEGSLGAPVAAPLAAAPTGSGTGTIVANSDQGIPSAPPAPGSTQQAAAPADGGARVVLRATQDSWIRISDAKDQPIMTQVLRAGETYAVPDQKGLTLLTGNAGGLTIELDGKALPPLGAAGAVKRNIALDPDKLSGTVN